MFSWYPEYEHLFAAVQLVLFMVGMGANLSLHDFIRVLRHPRSMIVAGIGQVFVLPFLAYGFAQWFDLAPGIAVGVILVSLMPGGTLSKVFTFLGRGNIPLSITLSAITTLLALVTVPMFLKFLAAAYLPGDFEISIWGLIHEQALYLLLPLVVGMTLGRYLPAWKKLISRVAINVGFIVVVAMVVCSLGSGRIKPGEHGWKVPIAIILFCLAGQQINMIPFYLLRWPRPDRLTAGIEVTMRNMNLALLVNPLLFPADGVETGPINSAVLFVILFYAATAMGVGVPLVLNHRRLWHREMARG